MPREQVNRPSLTSDPEGHLDSDFPAGCLEEDSDDLDEARVRGIEQSIERFAVPAQPKVSSRSENEGYSLDVAQRHPIALAELDPSDFAATHLCSRCQVDLAPAAPHAQGSDAAAKANEVHVMIVIVVAYAPINTTRPGARHVGDALQSARRIAGTLRR